MAPDKKNWTLGEIATLLKADLIGDPDLVINRPVPADSADPNGITFASDEKHLALARASSVGAVIVPVGTEIAGKATLQHPNPRQAFGIFLHLNIRPLPLNPGVHSTAQISPLATVDPSAQVGAFTVIESGAIIGARCKIYPFSYVGENCVLDEGVVLQPHAVILQDCQLGKSTIIGASTVVGGDGFGFWFDGQKQQKVPQVGGVVIGPEVEIGALTAVDRATAGDTVLEEGVKLDNFVQVAHNCRIGENSVLAAFAGLSGSTHIGKRVQVAGQVGFGGHIKITDDVILAGRSGVTNNIDKAGAYGGFPLLPLSQSMRVMAVETHLPELSKKIKQLERQVNELTETIGRMREMIGQEASEK